MYQRFSLFLRIFYAIMLYSKTFNKPNTDLRALTFGTQRCSPGHFYGYAIRSNYLIHYIHSGRGIYLHDNTKIRLGPGDTFLIIPGEPTYYAADKKNPWEYSWVSFSGDSSEALLKSAGFFNERLSISSTIDLRASYESLFRKMKLFSEQENGHHGITGLLLTFLLEAATAAGGPGKPKAGGYVSEIQNYIAVEYHHKISVAGIADLLNLDRSYMSTMFRKQTGESVQEYILRFRINKAISLLKDSTLAIKDIALSVGYSDQLAFSKIFRARTGLSPSNYRKSLYL